MTELEMAARFGLKSVVLARLGALGGVHLGTLCLISLCICQKELAVFQTGIYLLVPYLLTDAAALGLVRRIWGREAFYVCLGLAVLVGMLPVMNRCVGIWLWRKDSFSGWLWALGILCVIAVFEWKKSIERTEELRWNL